jgi:micrococcal nuclease
MKLHFFILSLCLVGWFPALALGLNVWDGDITVAHVLDGDTVELSNGTRIRLLGIDCPETETSGKTTRDMEFTGLSEESLHQIALDAKAFMEEVALGQLVRVDTDIVNGNINHLDKYGRTLAYLKIQWKDVPERIVYMEGKKRAKRYKKRWISLNALMLRYGYAWVYTRYTFTNKKAFRGIEKEARGGRIGLWAYEPLDEDLFKKEDKEVPD